MQTPEYTIYSLSHKGQTYVGQTSWPLNYRINVHRARTKGTDRNSLQYQAFRKHGFDNFKVKVLATCHTAEDANMVEQRYIRSIGNLNTRHR